MSTAFIKKDHVTPNGGMPQLYIDGKKTVPLWYALSDIPAAKAWNDCSQRGIKNFAKCGIDVVCVDTNLHEGWQENGEYDPAALLKDIGAVLRANPNAKVVTRLHLNPPYWWLHKYPEEQIVYFGKKVINGQEEWVELERTDAGTYGDRTISRKHLPTEIRVSIASEQFLHDCGEILKQLCKKVKAHPLGEHLIGIQPAYGTCGEWHYWGGDYNYYSHWGTDYSKPMQKLFRKIVRKRYATEDELKRFYGENATFENVTMAIPKEREETYGQIFMTPERYARGIDSLRTFSVASAEAIRYFCKCIKESWKEILTGAFYAYFINAEGASAAHLEPHRIFEDDNIDFLAGPCAYTYNKEVGNANLLRYITESCRINGKLYLCEMDQGYRSWNAAIGEAYVCESEEEYATLMKRNIMENILLGNGAWYYDHRLPTVSPYEKEEYWNTPERLQTIVTLQKTCEKLLEKPYKKTTDVLLVVDTERLYYKLFSSASFELIQAVFKSGAGVDRLYLKDLKKCDISRYKCVLFLDCAVIEQSTYDYIRTTVMNDGRTVVLINDFAKVVDKTTDESRVEQILGEKPCAEYAEYEQENCRICVMPETLADRKLYQGIFQRAGAHIYATNGEVIVADNEMVMMHCKDIPHTTLHLHCGDIQVDNGKYNTVVYNTFTGERVL
ncbi:MAG: hypothetical protein J6A63_01940 [Clostridia bacterium]|nr:hypothetical protein [Clostridia bacterium]